MSQQVQELIDKIKSEGVQAAEDKAREIENQAKDQAQSIIADSKRQAEQIIVEAKQEVKKMQESTRMALKQSSRDMLLSLRKEIEQTLQKIITTQVSDTLTSENLATILEAVIQKFIEDKASDSEIVVNLNPEDLEQLKSGFIAKLQKQLKQPIKFRSSDDIGKGFSISFDAGKSAFDFTDASLAEQLGSYLNTQVADLVKESV